MAFVKLDTKILDSTLWIERDLREIFITALLMAEPREFKDPTRQIEVGQLEFTDFEAPPGWYGFVPATDGGFLILNFMKYRDKDHTAADRQRKLRERRKQYRNGVT